MQDLTVTWHGVAALMMMMTWHAFGKHASTACGDGYQPYAAARAASEAQRLQQLRQQQAFRLCAYTRCGHASQ
jgi:hypothetical protein